MTTIQTVDNDMRMDAPCARFSWSRVKSVIRFFYPLLRGQMIIYPCVTITLLIVAFIATNIKWTDFFWSAPLSVISFMFYFAPMVLTRRDSRMVVTMLPATALEKTLVLLGYFLVVVPVLTLGLYYIVGLCVESLLPINPVIGKILDMKSDMHTASALNLCSELVPPVSCLWALVAVKRNRTMKVLLSGIGSLLTMGLIGVVYGVFAAFSSGFIDGIKNAGNNLSPEQVEELVSPMISDIMPFITVMGVIGAVYVLFAIWMIYRTLKTRQN